MANTIHAFDFLDAPAKYPPAGTCVLFGDEPFLKRLVLKSLREAVLGEDGQGVPFATFQGNTVEWRDVIDELSTVSLFGGGDRLVIVDEADGFVTANRKRLEAYLARETSRNVLILDVTTWAANTRLYKLVDKGGLQIACRAPEKGGRQKGVDEAAVCKWLSRWSRSQHDATLGPAAAHLLLELVGVEFGLLDQEVAKLALFAGPGGDITPEMVQNVVGGWRSKTMWEVIDAATSGNAAEALLQLDRLLQTGEPPQALFGQIAWSLRRFAAATRCFQRAEGRTRRPNLRDALVQAGFQKWGNKLAEAEAQLKQLRRDRAGQLYRRLLDADRALKGTHSQKDRARDVLESLIVFMARQADSRRTSRPPAARVG